jgi:type II secretory pathway component PulF
MLERLASFLEEQERLMDRIRGAMVYPLVVLVVGICVAVIMLGVLVPKAQEMFAGSELPLSLPMLTRFMIGMGTAMMTWGPVLVAAVVIAVLSVRRKLATDADFRMGWDRALFRAPLLGRGRAILANLRFSRTMAILLRGGVPLVDGIVLAGKATGSMWIGTLAEDAGEFIRHGGSLSDAVRRIPPLALSLPGWLQVGETSGNLEQLLDSASQRYQSQWERHIGTCLNFLEPLLIILVGGFVLVVTLSVLMPIISMRQMVGR